MGGFGGPRVGCRRSLRGPRLWLLLDRRSGGGSSYALIGTIAPEFDTGRVAQNIMPAADALGMPTGPITVQHTEDTARILVLPPGWECRRAVARDCPIPDARPSWSEGRKPSEGIFHQEPFGR